MKKKTVKFGNYELTRRIARGGMAEIFLALERGIEGVERQVAIKRILPHMSESDDFITMFMDEARVASRFSHPNIAHTYNFGEVNGVYFLAMEFIDGLTCAKLIRWNPKTIPLEITLRIGADICAALSYAHNIRDADGRLLGVVHRDVTPPNVMVSRNGLAKLLDFGVARASTQVHSTEVGKVKGKLGYIAPEVFRGKKLNHQADIFSVGVLLYEMITGVKLFRREVEAATVASILHDDPPPLSDSHEVPPELDQIIAKAVEKDPSRRYAGAREMQDALEELIVQQSLVATSYKVGRFVDEQMERLANERRLRKKQAREENELPSLTPSLNSLSEGVDIDELGLSDTSISGLDSMGSAESSSSVGFLDSFTSSPSPAIVGDVPDSARDSVPPRKRMAVIAAVLGLAFGALIAVIFFTGIAERDGTGAEAGTQASRVRADAGPEGPAVHSAVAIAQRPDAGALHQKASRETGDASTSTAGGDASKAVVHADASSPAAITQAVDAASTPVKQALPPGKLYLSTNPYSSVRLGRRSLGTTPLIGISVPAGSHALRLVDANGQRHSKRVRIRPGASTKVFFDLRPTGGGKN